MICIVISWWASYIHRWNNFSLLCINRLKKQKMVFNTTHSSRVSAKILSWAFRNAQFYEVDWWVHNYQSRKLFCTKNNRTTGVTKKETRRIIIVSCHIFQTSCSSSTKNLSLGFQSCSCTTLMLETMLYKVWLCADVKIKKHSHVWTGYSTVNQEKQRIWAIRRLNNYSHLSTIKN